MAKFKTVIRTLMVVFIMLFCGTTFYNYVKQGKAMAEELKPKLPDIDIL